MMKSAASIGFPFFVNDRARKNAPTLSGH